MSVCQRQAPSVTSLWRQCHREAWGLLARSIPPRANTCLQSHQTKIQDRLLCPQPEAGRASGRQVPLLRRGCCTRMSHRSNQGCSWPCGSQEPFREVAAAEHQAGVGLAARAGSCRLSAPWFSRTPRGEKATPRVSVTYHPKLLDLFYVHSSVFCFHLAKQRRQKKSALDASGDERN